MQPLDLDQRIAAVEVSEDESSARGGKVREATLNCHLQLAGNFDDCVPGLVRDRNAFAQTIGLHE